jgi:hypothetical protein
MNDLLDLCAHDLVDTRMAVAEGGTPNAGFEIDVPFSLAVEQITIL